METPRSDRIKGRETNILFFIQEQYPSSHLLKVPIIENPEDPNHLFSRIEKSFEKFPETNAVLIKGNGLLVCGDTWQEAKLMFDALLKLFQVAIEMKRVGVLPRAARVSQKETTEGDISIVHETKSAAKKRIVLVKAKPTGLSTDLSPEERPRVDREAAMKRKKLALLRLRERTSGSSSRRVVRPTSRRSAASFMATDSHFDDRNMNNMPMMAPIQPGINNFGNRQMQFNNSNNMGNNMGFHGMNQMNQMNMPGMNMAGMNMMMMNQNPGPGMFLNSMEQQGSFDRMEDMREVRSRSRARSPGGQLRRGGRGGRKTVKGNVKERLGFKSNITVDPALLNEENINEEDY